MVSGEAAIEIVFSIAAFPLTIAASSPTHTQKNPSGTQGNNFVDLSKFSKLVSSPFFPDFGFYRDFIQKSLRFFHLYICYDIVSILELFWYF